MRVSGAVVLVLAVTGCGQPAQTGADDGTGQRLEQAQRRLSDQALAGLAAAACPALPVRSTLAGLPSSPLACLGQGAARPVSAGDGRPTVVNLWASWCAPCVREMPLLEQTSRRAGDAVRFVGVDTQDERDSAAGLLLQTGVRYPQFDDPDGTVRSAARAFGLPVTLVFDKDGREVARRFGEIRGTWLDDALRKAGVTVPAKG